MAKNILKEAIADAKAVREVALANAKAALEEAFTPKLQSMLSAKLSQSLNEDEEEEDVDLDEVLGENDEDTIEEMGMYDEDTVEGDLDEEIDLEEILNELELDEDDSEDTMEEGEKRPDYPDVDDDGDTEESMEKALKDKEAKNENFDLDKLLQEINNLEEGHCAEGMYMTKEGHCMEMKMYDEGHCAEGMYMTKEGHCMEEGHGMSHNMMSEGPEIFTAMAGLAGVIGSAGILTAIEVAMDEPSFQEKHPKAHEALTKIFGFFRKIGGDVGKGIKEGDYLQEVKDIAYDELKNSRKALNKMKSELNEVNLLNSKLLYVNRIFKANNLSEAQKLRVVETLDKAESVKEAKLIYETVKDTFTISKGKKTTPKTSIKENYRGMASKAAGTSTAPKKTVLNESNDMVARMQKLANIKINQ